GARDLVHRGVSGPDGAAHLTPGAVIRGRPGDLEPSRLVRPRALRRARSAGLAAEVHHRREHVGVAAGLGLGLEPDLVRSRGLDRRGGGEPGLGPHGLRLAGWLESLLTRHLPLLRARAEQTSCAPARSGDQLASRMRVARATSASASTGRPAARSSATIGSKLADTRASTGAGPPRRWASCAARSSAAPAPPTSLRASRSRAR